MLKKFNLALFVILTVVISMQVTAHAYSYGDPNREKLAEVYEQIVVKLNESPPAFADAKALFLTVKDEEIVLHLGKEPAQVVLQNFENKDKEAVIQNMQKILALNISRRFEAIEQDFENYDIAKKLLAKAFSTYKALSPLVQEKNAELDDKIRRQFEAALESLGNPGLFGVGEQDSNKEQFIESKQFILDSLKEPFGIDEYSIGHFVNQVDKSKIEGSAGDADKVDEPTNWTDYANLKNWIPIGLIIIVILAVVIYAIRKRK